MTTSSTNTLLLDALRAYKLEEFIWSDEKGYYTYPSGRNKEGRKVSDRELFQAIYRFNTRQNSDFQSNLTRYINGAYDLDTWKQKASERIRANHTTLMEFGKGGKGKATAADYKIIEQYVKNTEYTALERFASDIQSGKLSEAQIRHRMSLYAYHSKVSYEEGVRLRKKKQKVKRAKRVLGNCKNHCSDCLAYAALGYVPISELILPGDRCACGPYCCCSVVYEE